MLFRSMFRPDASGGGVRFDVADENIQRRRYLIDGDSKSRIAGPEDELEPGSTRHTFARFAREHNFKVPLIIRHPDEEDKMIVFFGVSAASARNRADVLLSKHRIAVADKAFKMATSCGLGSLAKTYAAAGELHDEGKHHPLWQRAMGGSMDEPLAKVATPVNPKLTGGYRHEFGSLLKISHTDDDLLLHLIATHHAGGRPYFEARQFDREDLKRSESAALEQARRFGRLQSQYGPWGLAYLEAVFKCADGLVSAEEGESASD